MNPKDTEPEPPKDNAIVPEETDPNKLPSTHPFLWINLDKKGRIIIRNLVYDIREKHLRKLFEKYGEIVEVISGSMCQVNR